MVLIFLFQLLEKVAHGKEQNVFFHLERVGAHLFFKIPHLSQNLIQPLLQFGPLCIEGLPLLVGKLLVFLLRDGLSVTQRNQYHAADRALQDEALLTGFLFQLMEKLAVLLLVLVGDIAFLQLVVLAFENLGNLLRQPAHQGFHILMQLLAKSCGQLQTVGAGRIGEVVDIAPVPGHRLVSGTSVQNLFDG